jgi:hypothetical protein
MGTPSAPASNLLADYRGLDGVRRSAAELVVGELQHETQLVLAEQWVDVAHDARASANRDSVPYPERFLLSEVTGCDHLVTKPQFVSVPSHRRFGPSAEYHSRSSQPGSLSVTSKPSAR